MAGKIVKLIDFIIEKRAGDNKVIIESTKIKLLLEGIKVEEYNHASDDDPDIIDKLTKFASENQIILPL